MSGRGLGDGTNDDFDFSDNPTKKPGSSLERPRTRLTLNTDVDTSPQFQAVSMVPTPLISSNPSPVVFSDKAHSIPAGQRVLSASIVPDSAPSLAGSSLQVPRLHQNLLSPCSHEQKDSRKPLVEIPDQDVSLSRGNSLFVAKRGERPRVQLNRSVSVGGPQRQPSTVLHREPKVPGFIAEELPEEVYVASSASGAQTAWRKIKLVGKGSFSEVVLSRPAFEFLKPELAEEVDALADRELNIVEQEDSCAMDNIAADSTTSGPRIGHGSTASERADSIEYENPSMLVAVKITALNPSKTQAQLEYFKRDVDIMSNIPHHPSLMQMIGSSLDQEHHKRAIFVLPFCPGGDLFDLIAKHRSKLSSLVIRRLFADVCSAVVFLHENLIVHRDIKLENVLLDIRVSSLLAMERPDLYAGPLAVLTDLGLARRIDQNDPMLTTRCGSDDYVPPEIMLGQPYDGRETDSWALGVLLYAMLEGRLPFDAPPNIIPHEGSRARLKTAHRIARVDWSWHKRKDETSDEWVGGKEVVDACLKRRTNRRLAKEVLEMPWVANARPPIVYDPHNVDDVWQIFVQ